VTISTTTPHQLFIGGAWRDAEHGATFDVVDPATGEVITAVASASVADGAAALDAAVAAQAAWAATAPRARSVVLRDAFDLLMERREDFAALMTAEMGKPLAESRGEVTYGGEFLRWFSEEAARIGGHYGRNPEGTGRVIVTRAPVGPCLLITPWNFPLAMATRKLAPAIAAGCTSVVKPAELTPLTTLALVDLLREVGLPDGVVNAIPTNDSRGVCEPIIADTRLRKLSFTGSTPVGRTLLAQAAQGVLRTSMELGGNAPFVVFEDADVEAAVEGAMLAKFRNVGQACTAANRFLVHEDVAEDFTARLVAKVEALRVGPGDAEGTTIGPLVDARAVERITALVDDAVAVGARVLTSSDLPEGLPDGGSYLAPAVVVDVPAGAAILREEIFGPVVTITTFSSEDEALALANGTEYGLVSYAYTRDLARAQRLVERLDSGMTGINLGVVSNAAAPFGGVKSSGLGREGGSEGLEEYQSVKYALTPA